MAGKRGTERARWNYIIKIGFLFFIIFFMMLGVMVIRVHKFPDHFLRSIGHNKWLEIVIPGLSEPLNNAIFKYGNELSNNKEVDRAKYRKELIRYFGFDPEILDTTERRTLVIGSDTAIGTAIIQNLSKSHIPYVPVKGPIAFNLSVEDAWIPLDYLNIERAIFIHQPVLFRHSHSDGGEYIEAMSSRYVKGVMKRLEKRNINTILVSNPPHFEFFADVARKARVVLLPHLIDHKQPYDTENLVTRTILECRTKKQSIIESFDNEVITNMSPKQAASFILSDWKETGLFALEGDKSLQPTELKIEGCTVAFTRTRHTFRALKKPSAIILSNKVTIQSAIEHASRLLRPSNETYLSIIVGGRNDNYAGNFKTRAQNFLNEIGNSLERIPLANVEVVYVDYATPQGKENLNQVFTIPDNLKGRMKFIIVPEEFQTEKMKLYNIKLGFLEYFAKNIGIRRSLGQFAVAMNPDSLLSDQFFEFVSQRAFSRGVFYISNRIMMEENETQSIEQVKINEPWNYEGHREFGKFWYLENNKDTFGYEYGEGGLGDFTMLSRDMWEAVNAYDELGSNFYVDHTFKAKMLKLICGGFAANLPAPVFHQYHIHLSSKMPRSPLSYAFAVLDDYMKYGQLRQNGGSPDTPRWGSPDRKFKEIFV